MKAAGQEQTARFYEFGPFLLDTVKCVLSRDGETVSISLKAFEILLLLIEQRGQVVGKDEILKRAWPDTVVEENNLARNISTLRKALDEHPNDPQYILTVPGRGYRFVAQVREVIESSGQRNELPLHQFPRPAVPEVVPSNGHQSSLLIAPQTEPLPPQGTTFPQRATNRQHFLARALVILVAGIVLSGAVVFLIHQSSHSNSSTPQRKLWQLTFPSGLDSEPSWSPDGRLIAYASDRGGNFDIWVQPIGEGNPVRVTNSPAHDWQPDWAPEGNRLVFRSERDGGGLFVVPVLGGNERKVSGFGYRPRWSPDGSKILFYSSMLRNNTAEIPKVYLVGLDGEQPQEILTEFLRGFISLRVAWHPDGQRISVWGNHRQQGWGLWTVPIIAGLPLKSEFAAKVAEQIKEAEVSLTDFQWSSSGQTLYFEGVSRSVKNLWKVEVEPSSLRWISGPERLTTGTGLDTDLALSLDGRKLAFSVRNERTRIWALPFDARAGRVKGEGQPVTAAGIDPRFPDLSPDGRKLVFAAPRAGRWELWERSFKNDHEELLVTDELSRYVPRWSRDGSHLAYRRARPNAPGQPQAERAIVLLADGSKDEQVLTTPGSSADLAWDWSRDGKWILGGSDRQSSKRLMLVLFPIAAAPQAETQMRVVTSHPEENLYQARFSLDDYWISFCAAKLTEAGISSIYLVPAQGGEWTRITEGKYFDDKPRWSPDGRTLYFISNRTGFFNLWGIRFNPTMGKPEGNPFRVTTFDSPNRMILDDVRFMEIALTADRLILPIMEASGGIWILDNVGHELNNGLAHSR